MSTASRWRLILGRQADEEGEVTLEAAAMGVDRTLEALYDSERRGLGPSSPNVNRWLGDIRRYFPTPVVQLLQRDALERLRLDRMLLEPELLEAIEPDVHLVATLLSLGKILPDQSRATARLVVRRLVEDVERRLRQPLEQAVRGSLHRAARTYRPRPADIDWRQTIRANLKHYQPSLKTIIPERLIGYSRRRYQLRHVLLLMDQSGSMADSVVYAGILACILASLNSLKTHAIAFDTDVADLTAHLGDPVDLLFATQLGGGTDIAHALAYAEQRISAPRDTILILISDLYEGGSEREVLQRLSQLQANGVHVICLLALNDRGAPAYNRELAATLAALEIPTFACTPDEFPGLIASAIQREPVGNWLARR